MSTQKTAPQPPKVDVQALNKYLQQQFADYPLPSLKQFLAFSSISNGLMNAFTFSANPHTHLSQQISQLLQTQCILYLHSGTVDLLRKQGKHWKKQLQLKDGCFFTMINYRNMQNVEPEWYKLLLKNKCSLTILPIRPEYNFYWMRKIWFRNSIIARIFLYNDPSYDIQKRKQKFKDFAAYFQQQTFRRDTKLVMEGRKNQKIYFIAKGEVKLVKQLKFNNDKRNILKNVDILYLREGSIIGGELFLIGRKSIQTIINNHVHQNALKNNIKQQIIQEEEQENEGRYDNKKMRKKSSSRLGQIEVSAGGYTLYSPNQNLSNFTYIAESADLQIYYIQIPTLIKIIKEIYKINFLNLLQQTYITQLRRTHQKMTLQLQKQQIRIDKNHNKIQIMAAKAYSTENNNSVRDENEHQPELAITKSQIGIITRNMSKMQNGQVWKSHSNSIDRRAELIIKKTQPKINFKERIQSILQSKLAKEKTESTNQQIVQDLADIFMKSNEGRSEDIQKQQELLDKKMMLLEKRGGWKPGWNQLRQEDTLIHRRRSTSELPNYLAGIKIQEFADNLKYKCVQKIHQTNKIKEQFMKIKSECPCCTCYDNFQNFPTARKSMTNIARSTSRTAFSWGKSNKIVLQQQSLETVYNKMRFLSQKSKQKYNHGIHLLKVRKSRDKLSGRKTAPV